MKVAMEIGETLDVALIDGDRMVGTLSLSLKGVNVVKQVKAARAAVSNAVATAKGRKRGGKRRVSAESRARMAEAQRKRWAKFHASKPGK